MSRSQLLAVFSWSSLIRRIFSVLFCLLFVQLALSQSTPQVSTDCIYEDGKQLSIRYNPVASGKLPGKGQVWAPGGSPMFLFSQADLNLAGTEVPVGAYSLYVIPSENQWTLVVNKNVNAAATYDKSQDIVRMPMQTAKLGSPVDQLQIAFGRMTPTQCNLRIYYGSVGAFGVEMQEK